MLILILVMVHHRCVELIHNDLDAENRVVEFRFNSQVDVKTTLVLAGEAYDRLFEDPSFCFGLHGWSELVDVTHFADGTDMNLVGVLFRVGHGMHLEGLFRKVLLLDVAELFVPFRIVKEFLDQIVVKFH